jgi:MFS family permease
MSDNPQNPHTPASSVSSLFNFLNLNALDDIDPNSVKNSTAFKLGALAGILPVLSSASIASFLSSDSGDPHTLFSFGEFGIGSFVAMVISSALVGGAVAFFWAENRLRTVFTYGIAGPTIVLSLFLSGLSSLSAQKLQKDSKIAEDKVKEADATANRLRKEADQKVEQLSASLKSIQSAIQATASVNQKTSDTLTAPTSDSQKPSNPDLAQ